MERQDLNQMALRRFKAHKRPVEGEEGTTTAATASATPLAAAETVDAPAAPTAVPQPKKQKK